MLKLIDSTGIHNSLALHRRKARWSIHVILTLVLCLYAVNSIAFLQGSFSTPPTPTGPIEGYITDAASGSPLKGVSVYIWNENGYVASASSNDTGYYRLWSSPPSGSYYASTSNSSGYLDQKYGGEECFNDCGNGGEAIAVVEGELISGINFALNMGGRIAGKVTDIDTGEALGGIAVTVSTGDGMEVTYTNSSGEYISGRGLPSGNYYIQTHSNSTHLGQRYADTTCSIECDVTTGTPVAVSPPDTVSGIDFELVQGGQITGKFTDKATNTPLSGAWISVRDQDGNWFSSAGSDEQGNYHTDQALPAGTYYIFAGNTDYLSEYYGGTPCMIVSWSDTCDVASGIPVEVELRHTTSDIDFALSKGGSIAGTVIDAVTAVPLADVNIIISDSDYNWLSLQTDVEGNFTTTASLIAGDYTVRVRQKGDYINEVYEDKHCVGDWCDTDAGSVIHVRSGDEATVMFALEKGGALSGTVRDAITGDPLKAQSVEVYKHNGNFLISVASGITDENGIYRTSPGLPSGDYEIVVQSSSSHLAQVYGGGVPCSDAACESKGGKFIHVVSGTTTERIDFDMVRGGSISGIIRDAVSGAPLEGIGVNIKDHMGQQWSYGKTDAEGRYISELALASGVYYATTVSNNSQNKAYLNQIYGGKKCMDCWNIQGQAINVIQGQVTDGIDFHLSAGGRITGFVSDALSGSGVTDARIFVYDSNLKYIESIYFPSGGRYFSRGLLPGKYFVVADSDKHSAQFYDNKDCGSPSPSCFEYAELIEISSTETVENINFDLRRGGRISGRITDADSGMPLADVSITIHDTNHKWNIVSTDKSGRYKTPAQLLPGEYTVLTDNSSMYFDAVYGGGECRPSCDLDNATRITVNEGETVTGVDLALQRGGGISGKVVEQGSGQILRPTVRIQDAEGRDVSNAWIFDKDGNYYSSKGLETGEYYVRTFSEYLDECFDNKPCTWDEFGFGTPVKVKEGQVTTGIDFELERGGTISGTVYDAVTGAPLVGASVYAINLETGLQSYGYTDRNGQYRTDQNMLSSEYQVFVYMTGYVGTWLGDRPITCSAWECMGPPEATIRVTKGENVDNIDFALRKGGSISGKLTDITSGKSIAQTGVALYNTAGEQILVAYTNFAGHYSMNGEIPAGKYYLRTLSGKHVDQYFRNISLPADMNTATPLSVEAQGLIENIDFKLSKGHSLRGRVIDVTTGDPIRWAAVSLYDRQGHRIKGDTYASYTGEFTFETNLANGEYFLLAAASDYIPTLYPGVPLDQPCRSDGCDVTGATALVIGNEDLSGIVIALMTRKDSDRDGLPDDVEERYGLDPHNDTDALGDLDKDGLSNLIEFRRGTSLAEDNIPPVMPVLEDIIVAATAALTPIVLPPVLATEGRNATITAVPDRPGPYTVGEHTITWTAADAAGNSATATQRILVLPVVDFAPDQIVGEGGRVIVQAALNVPAANYPVEIPYHVSGTATASEDHDAIDGVLRILSGTEAMFSFAVHEDGIAGESDESIVITMGTPSEVLAGANTTHSVTITESNLAPMPDLVMSQAGERRRVVVIGQGAVTLLANVRDPNPKDTHRYDWNGTDNALIDKDGVADNDTFTFEPTQLSPGLYTATLSVSDTQGASAKTEMLFRVIAVSPSLSADADSDEDGRMDQVEGLRDSFGKGLPAYLDAQARADRLQKGLGSRTSFVMQTSPGLELRLGRAAFAAAATGAQIDMNTVLSHGSRQGGAALNVADEYDYPLGIFDFEIGKLPQAGMNATVVIALDEAIPENTVYRKFVSGLGWQDFVTDAANRASSAPGAQGACPPPHAAAYREGLHAGDYCLQLSLQDGGPNDGDGQINAIIADPGGIAVTSARSGNELNPGNDDVTADVTTSVKSGGGAIAPHELLLLLLMICLVCSRQRTGLRKY